MHAQVSPPPHPKNKVSQLLIREQYNHVLTALLWAVIICIEHLILPLLWMDIFHFFVLNMISGNIFFWCWTHLYLK